jgi:hypothetical protein
MATRTVKIMGVHGLGDQRHSDWARLWELAISQAFPQLPDVRFEFSAVTYDDIFEKVEISFGESLRALWKLTKSGVSTWGHHRGLVEEISDKIKWTAGYVVAWVEDEEFQRKSRARMLESLLSIKPDVICAHSLGSLITYNAFTHQDALADPRIQQILNKCNYVTLGSQIGNPFVIRNLTNGRILTPNVAFWHHLFNLNDDVFTAPIRLPGVDNFSQTNTPFDLPGTGDHAAESYLTHQATIDNVWRPLASGAAGEKRTVIPPAGLMRQLDKPSGKRQKALLVGINDYPDPANRLEGCVNDVFTMSSVLQDCGFPADVIRTCLDSRATAKGILDRFEWLLDQAKPGDELVFYYSGHGAQVPEYGENFEPDHHVETLVPWDFDWSPETYVADDQIYDLYSQLPYECRLIMIFDCCHSGGIDRAGTSRPRGIAPPDDIRHRELKWDSKTEMWVSRDFRRINEDFTPDADVAGKFFGKEGATQRLGRASMLRGLSSRQYLRRKKEKQPAALGPYLPLIIEACGENELSYEYRHGAASHGAFTFSFANILRRKKSISFQQLVDATGAQLTELQYNQRPRILGPTKIVNQEVPWAGG